MLTPDLQIDARQIATMVPHGTEMSLLDAVLSCDKNRIKCRAIIDDRKINPLWDEPNFPCVLLVEYAAQATAVHQSLMMQANTAGAAPPGFNGPAFLGAVKALQLHKQHLESGCHPLDIEASPLLISGSDAIYGFSISTVGKCLIEGRLTLVNPRK